MYRENYIESIKAEIVDMIAKRLTPVALNYGYRDVPLETSIKWRPQVLVLGNYSSGKSTLINDFLGGKIQTTGQAPTDDSFTVITYDDSVSDDTPVHVTEQRDGKFLLNDPEYPFENLKKYGQRFASHFCLKKVNSPFLKNLSIVDTPGMLDSVSEQDRGYNYQEVIGDLAHNAALVLVLFDPHKAGTGREAHTSLRETLPKKTFEDRIIFALNRVDECASMVDLLRVYGTLCWNLSQMIGRKDIPMIHLTYSPSASNNSVNRDKNYMQYLENQREELKKAILQAPKYQLDNMATFVETHSERLAHFLEALISYRSKLQMFRIKYTLAGLLFSLLGGAATLLVTMLLGMGGGMEQLSIFGGGGALLVFLLWMTLPLKYFTKAFHRNHLKDIDNLTTLETQTRQDSWEAIKDLAYSYLQKTAGRFSLAGVKLEYASVRMVRDKVTREIREALNELAAIRHDVPLEKEPHIELPDEERPFPEF